jgi:hypothetical protein
VQPKEDQAPAQQAAQNFQKPQEDFSDDVPF